MSPSSSLYLGNSSSVHDYLKKLGVTLVAANSPDHFLADCPKLHGKGPGNGTNDFRAEVCNGSETSQTVLAVGREKYHRAKGQVCVESECGAVALGRPYLFPPLSSGGALVARP